MRMVVCRCDASSDRGVRCPPEVGRVGRGRIGIGSARRVRVGHVARQEQDGDGGDGLGPKTQRGLLYSSPDGRGGSRSDKVSIGGTAATSDVHFVRAVVCVVLCRSRCAVVYSSSRFNPQTSRLVCRLLCVVAIREWCGVLLLLPCLCGACTAVSRSWAAILDCLRALATWELHAGVDD